MRWPWVSRATYEAMVDRLTDIVNRSHDRDARLMDRYDALLDRYHALKVQGATVPEPAPVMPDPEPPDLIEEAIAVRAQGNPMLRRHLAHWAAQQRAAGLPDHDVAATLTDWPDDEDEG